MKDRKSRADRAGSLKRLVKKKIHSSRPPKKETLSPELVQREELHQTILRTAMDGFWLVDAQGRLLEVNEAYCRMSGYSEKELLTLSVPILEAAESAGDITAHIQKIMTQGDDRFESRHRRKDGSIFDVEVSVKYQSVEGGWLVAFLRDITELKRAAETQAFLARTSSGTAGEPFFEALARYLAQDLGMDFVCIDRLEGDGLHARTVAVWCDGKFEDNVTYALKDTPCAEVVGQTVCCFPASVCKFFPRDSVLRDLRAESYIGSTLWSHTGQPIGLIAAIGRSSLKNRSQAETTLKLVSERAAGELERQQVEESLRRAKEDLEARVLERTRDLTATNDLLNLFSHTFLRREYLEALIKLLGKWCSCTSVGIRELDEKGDITYGAYEGFSAEFMEQEHCLSMKKDRCICPRVLAGKPDAFDLSFMTAGGSFYCNDTACLPSGKAKGMKKMFRGVCVDHKCASLAVIPIRYRERTLGAIHLADRKKGQVPLSLVHFVESMTPLIGEALYRFSVEEAFMTSRQQLRELSGHLLAAREEERTKVAREIHDELGQILTAAMIELAAIRSKYKKQQLLVRKIVSVSDLLDNAVRDIQRICSELRPRLLDHLGLRAALEWEAGQFSKRSGITCSLEMPPERTFFPAEVATSLFRICQEALTNVARHAGATAVTIRLALEGGTVVIAITDNGRGISREKLSGKKSFGIMGIHERTYDLGGTVTIKGIRNKGTTVTVKVPLRDTRGKHA
ncbi:MAG: hypothetical protein C0402_16800 [Thermodesulfovibrio sp.]|nr:hypothetical protein [Thermodesulfovibrio sp.]